MKTSRIGHLTYTALFSSEVKQHKQKKTKKVVQNAFIPSSTNIEQKTGDTLDEMNLAPITPPKDVQLCSSAGNTNMAENVTQTLP